MLRLLNRRAIARLTAPLLALVALAPMASPASALTVVGGDTNVTTLGWSVVGLDSNNVAVGPDEFPVGARYCTSTPVSGLTAHWQWLGTGSTTDNSLIKLADVAPAYETITAFNPQTTIVVGQTCYDAYWNVKLTRSAAAYDVDRGYQISFADAGGTQLGSTNALRRIYVEKLVSQNRNTVGSVSLDGGGTTLVAGNTYDFTVTGSTSTSYDQLTFASIFPAPAFQLLDANYTYTTATAWPVTASPTRPTPMPARGSTCTTSRKSPASVSAWVARVATSPRTSVCALPPTRAALLRSTP